MAELKIKVETDTSKVQDLGKQLGNVQKKADALSGTMKAINKAAEGQQLYFATTKARDGFAALLNEATKLEKAMADPKLQGTDKFRQLSSQLAEVQDKLTAMASSASMAGRVMSANFAREVSGAANAVRQMEQQMVIAKKNIDRLQSQMADRSVTVKDGGGDTKADKSFQGLSADLARQRGSLSGLEASLQSATGRLNSMREAQRVFGTATVSAASDTDVFLDKLNQIPVVGQATTGVFSQMKYALGSVQMALLGGLGFQQLGMRIFQTRSMMQNLEISFETMLQSGEKASALMGQLTQTAAKTPFGMMDVTNGAKQLLAYGTAAEDVNGILIRLGDISAGLGLSLGDLVYLYGTTMAQGRMFTQDLRQFMGRGIPMAEELGKILVAQGKATKGTQAEVQDAVTKGMVSADMVKQAIENMTASGSRFGGLMERQSSTLEGQWSNIEDTVDMMFNDMGKSTEGVFNSALSAITSILDNWQSIVKVIGAAIAAVGLYKTGVAAAALIERDEARQMETALREREAAQDKRLYSSIDERIQTLKEREAAANEAVGYDVADRKTEEAQSVLGNAVADSSVTNEQFDKMLEEAKANGVINDELEKELRLKREILMEQERLTAQAEQEAGNVSGKAEEPLDLETATRQRDETKKAIEDKDKEIADLDAQLQAAKEEYYKSNIEDYRNAKASLPTLQDEYESAKSSRTAAEAEYGKYTTPEYDAKISGQEFRASIAGARYGEDSEEYQSELVKLEELNAKREQAKVAFQQACEAEAASLQQVKDAQDALNSSTQSPVRQKAARVAELDDKIEKQQSVVDKAFESGNDENGFELQAAKQSLEDLRTERQVAVEEYKVACEQEIESLQAVIDKQDELNNATGGDTDITGGTQDAAPTGADAPNPAAEALDAVKEARESLTEAQEAGGEADDAVATVQEGLANAANMAGEAEEANTASTESNAVASETKAVAQEGETVATETGTVATEGNTVADTSNASAKKVAQLQSAQKTAMQEKETLATKLGTTQTQMDTLAQRQDTMAKQQNGIASAALGAKNALMGKLSAAGAVGQKLFNAAVNECTVAMNNLKIALLSNPITAIFTVLSTLGTALYMLWDNIFGSEDEAEAVTNDFANAAQEATNKTEQMYAQMAASAMGTKQHKEAMDELVKTCEEYGIKLNEAIMNGDDEIAKTGELNRVHQALTETLKQEAIQQEYLNNLKAAEETKDNSDTESRKDYMDDLDDDYFSSEEWSGAANQIYDEQIQKAGELKKAMEELQGARVKDAEWVEEYNSLQQEYNDLYQQTVDRTREYVQSIMSGKGRTDEYGEAVASILPKIKELYDAEADHAKALANSAEASENARVASEKAAAATSGMTEAQANAAKATRYSKMEVDELAKAAHDLVRSMSGKVIGIGVEFKTWMSNVNVPQWMLNKSSKDLSKDLQGWMNILNRMGSSNETIVNGLGRMTREQVLERVEQYSQAATQVKSTEDKAAETATTKKRAATTSNRAATTARKADADRQRAANDAARRRQQQADEERRWNERLEKEQKKAENATADLEVARIKNEGERKREENRRQHEKNLQQIEEQADEYRKATFEHNKKLWGINNTDKTKSYEDTDAGKAGWKGLALTKDQQDIIDAAAEKENIDYKEKQDGINRQILEDYKNFIHNYGTLQQEFLVQQAEYYEKLADIDEIKDPKEREWRRAELEKNEHRQAYSTKTTDIATRIDWEGLLDGVGTWSKDTLTQFRDQLNAYAQTGDFRKSDSDSQQKLLDVVSNIDQYIGSADVDWQGLGASIGELTVATEEYKAAAAEADTAAKQFANAAKDRQEGKITDAQFDAIKTSAEAAAAAAATAKDKMSEKGNIVNQQTDNIVKHVSGLEAELNKAEKYWGGNEGFSQVQGGARDVSQLNNTLTTLLPQLGDGMAGQIGSSLSGVLGNMTGSLGGIMSSALGGLVGIIAQIPKMILQLADSIKNFVTGIIDSIATLLKFEWLSDLVNSILEAVGNLIDTILDLPENLWHVISSIVTDGIGGLLNTVVGRVANIISFGALSSAGPADWFKNGNGQEVADRLEDLQDREELLTKAIDRLTEQLNETTGGIKSIKAAEETIAAQEEKNENLKQQAQTQAGYHEDHHSWQYYWNKGGFTDEEIAEFSKKIGREWNGDIWDLDTEEIAKLQGSADMWQKIIDTGKGGYGKKVAEALEKWADEAGKIDDITDTLKEKLTQTSFDSLRSDFLNTLMDMDSDAEDFADKFSEMLMQSVLNSKMADLMDDDLQAFYDKWAEYAKSDGKLSQAEIAELRADYDTLTDKALELRDQAAQITGYEGSDSDADSSTGAWSSLGEETGRALEGRFAALQIQVTKIADTIGTGGGLQVLATQVAAQTSAIAVGNQIADEGRTILAQMQLSLASIDNRQDGWDKPMKAMFGQIKDIRDDIRNKL